jgi:ABC-type transport system substrate-binding protein
MPGNYWAKLTYQRIRRRRAITLTGGAALGAAFLAACGGGNDNEPSGKGSGLLTEPADSFREAKRGGTLKDRASGDSPTLDIGRPLAGGVPTVRVYSALVRDKPGYLSPPQGELAPDVAESWERSPDGLQITLKLRQGVKFHNKPPVNGRVLDAEDVVFSWNRFAATASNRAMIANSANPAAPVLSLTASDSRTIVIKLKEPLVYTLELLATYGHLAGGIAMMPKETDSTFDSRSDMIGTGPFVMTNYTPSVGWTVKRNPEYFDKDFALVEQIDAPIVSEYATALAQFKAGNIYYFEPRSEDILAVKREEPRLLIYPKGVNYHSAAIDMLTFGVLPDGKSPFLDERVRQAISMSWDRDLMNETFHEIAKFEAEGLPMETRWHSHVLANWDGWWLDPRGKDFGPNAKYFQHDLVEAKKLLAAAGHPNGLDVTSHYTTSGSIVLTDKARYYAAVDGMTNDVGTRIKIEHADFATQYGPLIRDGSGQYEGWGYHSLSGGLPRDIGPVSALVAEYWPKSGASFRGFSASGKNDQSGDPQLTSLLEKARLEQDIERRRALTYDIQRYLGKAMWGLLLPGGATSFTTAWPALRNFLVWKGTSVWSHYRLWLDETKPPFTAA